MNRDDIFTEKAKNDDGTSNDHKMALECPISANDHFRKACENTHAFILAMLDFEIQNCQKTKGRASKLELKFPIKIFISIIQFK